MIKRICNLVSFFLGLSGEQRLDNEEIETMLKVQTILAVNKTITFC